LVDVRFWDFTSVMTHLGGIEDLNFKVQPPGFQNRLDFAAEARIGVSDGGQWWGSTGNTGLASRNAGLWVVAPLKAGQRGAPMAALRHQRSPIMATKTIDKSDRSAVTRRAAGRKATITRNQAATTTTDRRREALLPEQPTVEGRVTKLVKLLQLLNRPEGASIEDMMQATEWQQHSVRGFLAGTVKKKMGLALTSSNAEGEVRRYRIAAPRRGR
jgi:hypothetical protein